jgi:hypothetical protein
MVSIVRLERISQLGTLAVTSNSQETHHVPATEPNRFMLFGETVAVYCENRTEHINTLCGDFSSYLTGDTSRPRYRAQPVNAVWGNSRFCIYIVLLDTMRRYV